MCCVTSLFTKSLQSSSIFYSIFNSTAYIHTVHKRFRLNSLIVWINWQIVWHKHTNTYTHTYKNEISSGPRYENKIQPITTLYAHSIVFFVWLLRCSMLSYPTRCWTVLLAFEGRESERQKMYS